ncbi:MAG TPA: hypothetical protein VFM74_00615 [Candidatus Limnocylindria bacterium]|nr:hypothetical protein [Candidatus Limnocylindria bacterium]
MASYWKMQAELRQQELLDDARARHIASCPSRRRRMRIFGLVMPQLRRIGKR